MARLFGTDGVRGEANTNLPPELAFRLGRAATIYFGEHFKKGCYERLSQRNPNFDLGCDIPVYFKLFARPKRNLHW